MVARAIRLGDVFALSPVVDPRDVAQEAAQPTWTLVPAFRHVQRPNHMFISSPAVQGKTMFLSRLLRAVSRVDDAMDRMIVLVPRLPDCADRSTLAGFFCRQLGSSGRVLDFGDILSRSELLQRRNTDRLSTTLIVDLSRCTDPKVLEWVVHSVFMLDEHFQDIARRIDIRCFLVGSFERQMLGWEHVSKYELPHIVVPNFSEIEIPSVLASIETRSDILGGIRFQPNVRDAVFAETGGDKYFVNLLCALAAKASSPRVAALPLSISADDIRIAAQGIRSGELYDSRVTEIVDRWVDDCARTNPRLRDELMALIEQGADVWNGLGNDTQLAMFQKGVVGLAPRPDGKQLTVRDILEHPDAPIESRYQVRNPMIKERIRRQVDQSMPRKSPLTKKRRGLAKLLSEERSFLERRDELRRKYPGRFVAVHEGRVVDSDDDRFALARRNRKEFPGTCVLVRHVDFDQTESVISSPADIEDR